MAGTGVRIVGADEAKRYLRLLQESASSADKAEVRVGSPLGYAYGIETGTHRSGKRARAAGGVFFLARAYAAEKGQIKKRLSKAIKAGHPVLDELKKIGLDVERRAKELVVVVTGTLRRSLQTIYPGRPVTAFASPRGGRRTRRTVRPR